VANNNQIYKMSNAGGFKSLTRYYDMLAGNTTWNPWEPQGAFDALATVTVGSTAVSSVTFAGIPTGYKHLQIRGMVLTSGATNPTWQVNGDTTGGNYAGHHLWGTGATAASNAQSGTVYWNYNPSSSYPSAFVMDWLDYASTTKNKTMRCLAGSDTNGGTVEVAMWSGLYMSLNPITSITLNGSGANFTQYSSFALYGVK
jgi:hypothetical protein